MRGTRVDAFQALCSRVITLRPFHRMRLHTYISSQRKPTSSRANNLKLLNIQPNLTCCETRFSCFFSRTLHRIEMALTMSTNANNYTPKQSHCHHQGDTQPSRYPEHHYANRNISTARSTSHPTPNRSSSPFASPTSLTTSSPAFPLNFHEPKVLHVADISYPESYLRTPMPQLVSQPVHHGSKALSTTEEEDVRQSIEETSEDASMAQGHVWGDGTREWAGWVEHRKDVERACMSRKRSLSPALLPAEKKHKTKH